MRSIDMGGGWWLQKTDGLFGNFTFTEGPGKMLISEVMVKFGITARQFNGVKFLIDQAVATWKETLPLAGRQMITP